MMQMESIYSKNKTVEAFMQLDFEIEFKMSNNNSLFLNNNEQESFDNLPNRKNMCLVQVHYTASLLKPKYIYSYRKTFYR